MLLGVFFMWHSVTDSAYRVILFAVSKGVLTTLYVAFIAYAFSTFLGLLIGLMRNSPCGCYAKEPRSILKSFAEFPCWFSYITSPL